MFKLETGEVNDMEYGFQVVDRVTFWWKYSVHGELFSCTMTGNVLVVEALAQNIML